MTLLRIVARPMLASMFIAGGVNAIRNAAAMAPTAKPVSDKLGPLIQRAAPQVPLPSDTAGYVRLDGVIHVVGGAMLATGRFPRLSTLVLAGSLVPTTLAGHAFWNESDPSARQNQQVHFFKNVSMIGGLLMASLDPDPKKKMLPRRAKDRAVDAGGRVAHAVDNLLP
ncbi:MAG: DoxX family protein [Nocardioidaceae bacterium]|nr:DoxX family protein [Nocardioidaceae bacterium]